MLRKFLCLAVLVAVAITGTGCDHIDDSRIPAFPVNVTFRGQQVWDVYGVHGALDHRRFIKDLNEPAGFYYVVSDCTGFGGLLLVCDVYGTPQVWL